MPSQSLTQVINNITVQNNQLTAAFQALPSPVPNQAEMITAMQGSVSILQNLQTQIRSFATSASPMLTDALTSLNNNNFSDASAKVQTVNTSANTLKGSITSANSQLNAITPKIVSVLSGLNTQHNTLNAQLASLQGQLQDAQNQVDYYNKRKWYFLLLGPFGIAGVAAAAALIITWTNKANGYQSDVNNISNQINSVNNSIQAVTNAQTTCTSTINIVSLINNTVDVMFSDIGEVITDLSSQTPITARLYINAALTEIQVLTNDAS
jgi:hypothetical protein